MEISSRINWLPIDANLIVDMRPRRKARTAHISNNLTPTDMLPCYYRNLHGMPITGHDTIAMIDIDHIAIAAIIPASRRYNTISSRNDRSSHVIGNIYAWMKV